MAEQILADIQRAPTPGDLFELAKQYYAGMGFAGVCYVAPEAAAGPYVLMEHGMPEEWIARYRANALERFDPIPGIMFRLGQPERLHDLLDNLPNLTEDERCFIAAYRSSGITNGLAIPAYGPFGRPGFIGLAQISPPHLLDTVDTPLAAAVAQQIHTRMELLQVDGQVPALSPREREILGWLAKGKSASEIATILGIAVPTVATHVKRIYAKMQVNDRVACVAKALSMHYI